MKDSKCLNVVPPGVTLLSSKAKECSPVTPRTGGPRHWNVVPEFSWGRAAVRDIAILELGGGERGNEKF